ncbi:MAG: hypothetical protein ACO3JL_08200 [Myxococcota bacterium]
MPPPFPPLRSAIWPFRGGPAPRVQRDFTITPDGVIGGNGSVSAGGARAAGEVNTDLRGRVGASGSASYTTDGFDARANATWGPGGLRATGRVGAGHGPVRTAIDVGSDGSLTPSADMGGALGEGVRYSLHLDRSGNSLNARAGGSLRLSKALGTPQLGLSGTLRRTDPELVTPGQDPFGDHQRQGLAKRPGARLVRHRLESSAEVTGGAGLPHLLGNLDTGGRRQGGLAVTVERFELPGAPSPEVPATANDLLVLSQGEAFTLEGRGQVSARLSVGGSLPAARLFGAGGSVDTALTVDSELRVRVEREEGTFARVRLESKAGRDHSHGARLHMGLMVRLPKLMRGGGLVLEAAEEALRLRGERIVHGLGQATLERRHVERSDGIDLVELRLDLSHPEVRRALDEALEGDWSELENLADEGKVERLRSVFAETRTHSLPAVSSCLGIFSEERTTHERSRSTTTTPTGTAAVDRTRSAHDGRWRTPFRGGASTLERLVQDVQVRGQPSGPLPVDGAWLQWGDERERVLSSVRALDGALSMASYVGDDEMRALVGAYREKLAEVSEERLLGIGPRHELGRTKARIRISLDDEAIERAEARSVEDLWPLAAQAWSVAHPHEEMPLWAKERGRRSLEEHGPLRHGHADYAPYHEMRAFLEELVSTKDLDAADRLAALKTLLDERWREGEYFALLARLAGPAHVRVELSIDTQGQQTALDLVVDRQGAAYAPRPE